MLFVDDFLYEIAEKKYDIFLRFLEGNSFHLLNEDISEEDLQIFNNEWQIFQKHTNELVNRFKNELTKSNETFFSITENILKNDELSSELKKIWYNTASKIVNTFDEFHGFFYDQKPLTGKFLNRLNEVDAALKPIIEAQRSSELKRREAHLKAMGLKPSDLKAPVSSQSDEATHYSATE